MRFYSEDLINLIGNFELDMLGFLVSQALQQKSNEITITTDQYLTLEVRDLFTDNILRHEDKSYETLDFMLETMVNLESMGLLTFALDYDKTMRVRINPQVFNYFVSIPDEIIQDLSLQRQERIEEKQALGQEKEEDTTQSSCKVIPFPR